MIRCHRQRRTAIRSIPDARKRARSKTPFGDLSAPITVVDGGATVAIPCPVHGAANTSHTVSPTVGRTWRGRCVHPIGAQGRGRARLGSLERRPIRHGHRRRRTQLVGRTRMAGPTRISDSGAAPHRLFIDPYCPDLCEPQPLSDWRGRRGGAMVVIQGPRKISTAPSQAARQDSRLSA